MVNTCTTVLPIVLYQFYDYWFMIPNDDRIPINNLYQNRNDIRIINNYVINMKAC